MRFFPLLLMLISLLSADAQTINLDSEEWMVTKEEKGMQIYFRTNTTGNVVECRIVTELPASRKEVMAYLTDAERFDEWATVFRDSRMHQLLGPNEFRVYAHARSHLTTVDSDILLHYKFVDLNGGIVGYFYSEPDSVPRVPGLDRMQLFEGRIALLETSNRSCKFTYHLATDLGTSGIGDQIAKRVFVQANTESVERLRAHFEDPRKGK